MLEEFVSRSRAAYFSVEAALRNDSPTCSGRLGGLAGNTVRSADGKLESVVLPQRYAVDEGRCAWVRIITAVIAVHAAYCNSQCMMRRCATGGGYLC
jgi:hypothetical protein